MAVTQGFGAAMPHVIVRVHSVLHLDAFVRSWGIVAAAAAEEGGKCTREVLGDLPGQGGEYCNGMSPT